MDDKIFLYIQHKHLRNFEDSKEVIRCNKLQKERQRNGKKKKDKHITQKTNNLAS